MNLPQRDKDGKWPRWAWPGGYPLYYITLTDCVVLCPECADKHDEGIDPIGSVKVNWEDPMLWCEACNQRIESAYAEEEHPDAEDKTK